MQSQSSRSRCCHQATWGADSSPFPSPLWPAGHTQNSAQGPLQLHPWEATASESTPSMCHPEVPTWPPSPPWCQGTVREHWATRKARGDPVYQCEAACRGKCRTKAGERSVLWARSRGRPQKSSLLGKDISRLKGNTSSWLEDNMSPRPGQLASLAIGHLCWSRSHAELPSACRSRHGICRAGNAKAGFQEDWSGDARTPARSGKTPAKRKGKVSLRATLDDGEKPWAMSIILPKHPALRMPDTVCDKILSVCCGWRLAAGQNWDSRVFCLTCSVDTWLFVAPLRRVCSTLVSVT